LPDRIYPLDSSRVPPSDSHQGGRLGLAGAALVRAGAAPIAVSTLRQRLAVVE